MVTVGAEYFSLIFHNYFFFLILIFIGGRAYERHKDRKKRGGGRGMPELILFKFFILVF